MDKEKDILTGVFQNRLKDYKMTVEKPDEVWAAIEGDLTKRKTAFYLPWRRIALLSSAAVLAAFLYMKFWVKENHNIAEPEIPTVVSVTPQERNLQPERENTLAYARKKVRTTPVDMHEEKVSQIIPEEAKPKDVDNDSVTIPEELKPAPKQDTDIDIHLRKNIYTCSNKKKRNKDISFSLAMRNSGTLSPDAEKTTNYVVSTAMVSSSMDKIESGTKYNANAVVNAIVIDTKYGIPVSAGLTVRKQLVDSWALESGLVYTYLSTTETLKGDFSGLSNTGSLFEDRKTELHYAGIPLKAVYSFYNSDRISLYLTAGGMGEFCVYGKESANRESTRLRIPEIQWSVFAGAGINYKLVNRLSLFFEPEVTYYFDDSSEVKTIRKSVPFNINLQAGLRLAY